MITCAFNGKVMTPTQLPNVSLYVQEIFGHSNEFIQISGSYFFQISDLAMFFWFILLLVNVMPLLFH